MITTNKKEMEQYYGLNAEDVKPVRLNTDEVVYISKKADMTGKRLIRMYRKNGRAIVDKRWKCKEYTPVLLHPANICTHDRATWKTFTTTWGDNYDYCPVCTPPTSETHDPLNVESNPC